MMDIIEVLKIQNRLIEHNTNMVTLKEFNDTLISELEFEKENPIMFNKEITKMLVSAGFKHEIRSAYSRYVNYQLNCFFNYGIAYDTMVFTDKEDKKTILQISVFTEDTLTNLLL